MDRKVWVAVLVVGLLGWWGFCASEAAAEEITVRVMRRPLTLPSRPGGIFPFVHMHFFWHEGGRERNIGLMIAHDPLGWAIAPDHELARMRPYYRPDGRVLRVQKATFMRALRFVEQRYRLARWRYNAVKAFLGIPGYVNCQTFVRDVVAEVRRIQSLAHVPSSGLMNISPIRLVVVYCNRGVAVLTDSPFRRKVA